VQYPEECATLVEMSTRPTAEPISGYLFNPPSRWEAATPDPVFQFVAMSNSSDAEKLALLRRHYRHLSFVAGVRDLMELRPVYQSLSDHSAAADDMIRAAFTLAGQPQGLAVLALGRLGAAEFDVFSDADLIFARDEELPHEVATKAVELIVHALPHTRGRDGISRGCPVAPSWKPRRVDPDSGRLRRLLRRRSSILEALTYTKLRSYANTAGGTGSFQRHGESVLRFRQDPDFRPPSAKYAPGWTKSTRKITGRVRRAESTTSTSLRASFC